MTVTGKGKEGLKAQTRPARGHKRSVDEAGATCDRTLAEGTVGVFTLQSSLGYCPGSGSATAAITGALAVRRPARKAHGAFLLDLTDRSTTCKAPQELTPAPLLAVSTL